MPRILIASCEAGGAEILSSMIRRKELKGEFLFCLEDPAVKIFERKLGPLSLCSLETIRNLDPERDEVITGTSWIPELERTAIRFSKESQIRSTSVIDHWTNYKSRFLPPALWKEEKASWKDFLPERIWVFDSYAFEIANKEGFPMERIALKSNPYFEDLREALSTKDASSGSSGIHILYLSEPIRDDLIKTYGDPNYWGYTEYDLVNSLVQCLKLNEAEEEMTLRLRLHPNEPKHKYDELIQTVKNISYSESGELLDDLAWADIVIGGESMAMVIALLAEKTVYSCIPEGKSKTCSLPHREIKKPGSMSRIFEEILFERCPKRRL